MAFSSVSSFILFCHLCVICSGKDNPFYILEERHKQMEQEQSRHNQRRSPLENNRRDQHSFYDEQKGSHTPSFRHSFSRSASSLRSPRDLSSSSSEEVHEEQNPFPYEYGSAASLNYHAIGGGGPYGNNGDLPPQVAASLCTEGEAMRICVPPDYMKFELPEDGAATHVSIGVDIKDIPKVNDKDFSITINAYFIVKWRDQRLIVAKRNRTRSRSHQPPPPPKPSTTTTTTTQFTIIEGVNKTKIPLFEEETEAEGEDGKLTAVNIQILRNLWLPDVEILNLKAFETHSVLSKLEGIWIDNQSTLMYALATRITFICPMKFNAFPMDIQVCKFQVGSFNYDMSKMVFANEFVPDEEDAIKSILDYQIEINDLRPEQTHYMALGMNYSVAGFEMILTRKVSFYIVTYYLPSGLFVVVSWISFLVDPQVIPGRMTLLVTIFLVLINIFNTIQTNSPKAEGLTAIEAWVIACIIFVFGALGEYTVILLKIKLKKLEPRRSKSSFKRAKANASGKGQGSVHHHRSNNLHAHSLIQSGMNAALVAAAASSASGAPPPQTTTLNNSNNVQPSLTKSSSIDHNDHGNNFGGGGSHGSSSMASSAATLNNIRKFSIAAASAAGVPSQRSRENYGRTDLIFLVVFPLLFAIFNIFYWTSLYWWRWSDKMDLSA